MLTLRMATPDDLETIVRHRESMFRAMGRTGDIAVSAASRQFFAEALAEGRYFGWFFEHSGRAIAGGGIVLLAYQPQPGQPGPLRPFAVNVWTDEDFRGQGLARRLMEAMIAWTREQGYGALNLHASEAARPIYEKLGFVATNEMRLWL